MGVGHRQHEAAGVLGEPAGRGVGGDEEVLLIAAATADVGRIDDGHEQQHRLVSTRGGDASAVQLERHLCSGDATG